MQKTYTVDFLTKKRVKNDGYVRQYYIEDNHEAIIPKELFHQVQAEKARRASLNKAAVTRKKNRELKEKSKYSSKYILTDLMVCAECGHAYRRQIWSKYGDKSAVWRCEDRLKQGKKSRCQNSPTLKEEQLHNAIMKAINNVVENTGEFIGTFRENIIRVIGNYSTQGVTTEYDEQIRLLSALGDNHRYSETVVTAGCGDTVFTTKGKTILQNGFKEYEVLLNMIEKQDEKSLPLMAEGEVIENCNAEIKEGKTSPPKQFTEDTLLLAMETTGKDENIEKEFCGIGTPATRAGIIEKLISINLLERKGDKKTKYLLPTDKGNALITILPESIQSPLTTAEWEEKLRSIETGDLSANEFLSEISKTIENLVRTYDVVKGSEQLFPSQNKVIGKCPRCGSNVIENKKGFCCENRTCGFALWKENKFFTSKKKTLTEKIVKDLLTTGKCKLTGCYSEKTGKTYNATVSIDETVGKYVNFVLEFEKRGK